MIVSHQFETVFMHIPKCAGTSIRQMLGRGDPECEKMWGYRFLPRHQRFGDSAHIPLVDLPPDKLDAARRYTAFAVIRDPLERFLSAISQHLSQHAYRTPVTASQILDEVDSVRIRYDAAYIHFCPQHFFTHIGDRQLVDRVFRMDDPNMDKLISMFLSQRGFASEALELGRVNESTVPKLEPDADFDMERFYQLYKRDYDLFGFEPPMERSFRLDADAAQDQGRPFDFSSYDEVRFLKHDFRKG